MRNILKTSVASDIEFAYRDSGPPLTNSAYSTIIIIHGHTYHSGTFEPMLEQAHMFSFRVILLNRRLYPGSTPYTQDEFNALHTRESVEEATTAFLKQGEYLLLAVSNIITELDLKSVLLVGWSMGGAFLSAIVASIASVAAVVKQNVLNSVKGIVLWDAPATAHGFPDPPTGGWIPLYDSNLRPEERGPAFGKWIAQYYPHRRLDEQDCQGLVYKISKSIKPATWTGISVEKFLEKVDLGAGEKGDNIVTAPIFQPVVASLRERSLFNREARSEWDDTIFSVIYGEESPYNVQWASWKLQEEAKRTGLYMRVIGMPGANHFAMEDHTDLVFRTLKACL